MSEKDKGKKKGKKTSGSHNVRRRRSKRPGRENAFATELSKEQDPKLRALRKAILKFGMKPKSRERKD